MENKVKILCLLFYLGSNVFAQEKSWLRVYSKEYPVPPESNVQCATKKVIMAGEEYKISSETSIEFMYQKYYKSQLFRDYCKNGRKNKPFFCYERYETNWDYPDCLWVFQADKNCQLVAKFVSPEGIYSRCQDQYLFITDTKSQFKACGKYKHMPKKFISKSGKIIIEHYKKHGTYSAYFTGVITCDPDLEPTPTQTGHGPDKNPLDQSKGYAGEYSTGYETKPGVYTDPEVYPGETYSDPKAPSSEYYNNYAGEGANYGNYPGELQNPSYTTEYPNPSYSGFQDYQKPSYGNNEVSYSATTEYPKPVYSSPKEYPSTTEYPSGKPSYNEESYGYTTESYPIESYTTESYPKEYSKAEMPYQEQSLQSYSENKPPIRVLKPSYSYNPMVIPNPSYGYGQPYQQYGNPMAQNVPVDFPYMQGYPNPVYMGRSYDEHRDNYHVPTQKQQETYPEDSYHMETYPAYPQYQQYSGSSSYYWLPQGQSQYSSNT